MGCVLTSAESLIYEVMASAAHPKFKSVISLVKAHKKGKDALNKL